MTTSVWLQTFALGWHVVQLAVREGTPDRAPLFLGLVGISRAAPGLIAGLLGGALADRLDRRNMLLVTQSLAGSLAALLAILAFTGRLGLLAVLLASAVSGIVASFDTPSRQGMVPRLVPRGSISSAVGLILATTNIGTLLGPGVGGLLIGAIGVSGLLLCTAGAFFVVIGALLAMQPVPREASGRSLGMLRSIGEVFAYVWGDRLFRPVFIVLLIMSLLARPITQMLPAVAENVLHVGAVELSWLLAASGAGAFVGSITSASLGGFERRGLLIIAFALASGTLLWILALQSAVIPALLLVALTSLTVQAHITNHVTVYQMRSPGHLQGRMVGVSATIAQSGLGIGSLILGLLGTLFGLQLALALAGLVVILTCGWVVLRYPQLRDRL